MPVIIGSTTASMAAAAMAPSIAEPPARSMSSPARVAAGWDVAAIPRRAITTLRPGR